MVQHVKRDRAGLLNFTETDGMLGIRKNRAEWDLEGFEAPSSGITFVPKEASSSHLKQINVWISRVSQLSGRQIDIW